MVLGRKGLLGIKTLFAIIGFLVVLILFGWYLIKRVDFSEFKEQKTIVQSFVNSSVEMGKMVYYGGKNAIMRVVG